MKRKINSVNENSNDPSPNFEKVTEEIVSEYKTVLLYQNKSAELIDPSDPTLNNTNDKRVGHKVWYFTWNNYPPSAKDLLTREFSKYKYICGFEVGAKKGTPHVQGFVDFGNTKKKFNTLIKINKKIHWKKFYGFKEIGIRYCAKDGKYFGNLQPIEDKLTWKKLCLMLYEDIKWKGWQSEIIESVKAYGRTPLRLPELRKAIDSRTINWYWEPTGNCGKTFVYKYMYLTERCVLANGNKTDVFHNMAKWLDDNKPGLFTVVLNYSREEECHNVHWGLLENLKDGIFLSGKYEGRNCLFPAPKIIIFANYAPKFCKLSDDRLIVKEIKND